MAHPRERAALLARLCDLQRWRCSVCGSVNERVKDVPLVSTDRQAERAEWSETVVSVDACAPCSVRAVSSELLCGVALTLTLSLCECVNPARLSSSIVSL